MDDSNRRFGTFVFDLDGTLLDTLPDLIALTNATLRECAFPERTPEEILSFVGNGVKALMHQAVPPWADRDAVERAMARWKELYPSYGHRLTKPYPGIPETLLRLKERGAKLAVLSNKFDGGVQEVIASYLPGLFSVVHGERAGIPRKPDPTGLLRTIEELGSTPQETAYVGDSTGDAEVALAAGAYPLCVAWGYHDEARLREAGAGTIVSRADELLRFAR